MLFGDLAQMCSESMPRAFSPYLQQGREALDPAAAELWFAGQPLAPGATLSARLGRNDKTRVVLRLQRCGQGAPTREPVRHILSQV